MATAANFDLPAVSATDQLAADVAENEAQDPIFYASPAEAALVADIERLEDEQKRAGEEVTALAKEYTTAQAKLHAANARYNAMAQAVAACSRALLVIRGEDVPTAIPANSLDEAARLIIAQGGVPPVFFGAPVAKPPKAAPQGRDPDRPVVRTLRPGEKAYRLSEKLEAETGYNVQATPVEDMDDDEEVAASGARPLR